MYLIFFGVGVGFILLSLVMGEFMESEGSAFSFLKPTLIAVFLTIVGGLGLLLEPRFYGVLGDGVVLAISLSGGFVAAMAINIFIIKPLYKAQNTSTFSKEETIGVIARVISPIPRRGYGKISYSISGSTVTSPAKSEDEDEIRNGETVEIVDIEGGTYFVRRT